MPACGDAPGVGGLPGPPRLTNAQKPTPGSAQAQHVGPGVTPTQRSSFLRTRSLAGTPHPACVLCAVTPRKSGQWTSGSRTWLRPRPRMCSPSCAHSWRRPASKEEAGGRAQRPEAGAGLSVPCHQPGLREVPPSPGRAPEASVPWGGAGPTGGWVVPLVSARAGVSLVTHGVQGKPALSGQVCNKCAKRSPGRVPCGATGSHTAALWELGSGLPLGSGVGATQGCGQPRPPRPRRRQAPLGPSSAPVAGCPPAPARAARTAWGATRGRRKGRLGGRPA